MYTNLELFGQLDFENARTFLVQALTECIKSSGAEDTIKGLQKHELIDVSTFSPSNPNGNNMCFLSSTRQIVWLQSSS